MIISTVSILGKQWIVMHNDRNVIFFVELGQRPKCFLRNKPREVLSVTEQEAIEKIHSVYPTGTKNGRKICAA